MEHFLPPLPPQLAPKRRGHIFWVWYERLTALIGWMALPIVPLVFWNKTAELNGWPTYLEEFSAHLWSYLAAALVWIIKADIVKYRATRDPRDKPFRKWLSLKHAQKFKPGERIFVREPGFVIGNGSLISTCKTCGHIHGFPADKVGMVYDCTIYGCKGQISLTDPANYNVYTGN